MFKLSDDQEAALDAVIQFLVDPGETEMAISGPGGTGKTVLTRFILKTARERLGLLKLITNIFNELEVHLTSTTNKAAKVLFDATGEETKTIHSLLGLRVYNDFKTGKQVLKKTKDSDVIENALIIVDEASMCDESLLKTIRESTHKCKVIYIGDAYQLAPVFESTCPVFEQVKNQVRLTTIQRQAAGSPIIQFASAFRNALDTEIFPLIESHGNAVQHLKGPQFQAKVDQHFSGNTHIDHARLVAWTNRRVHQYNEYVRAKKTSEARPFLGEYLLTNQPIIVNGVMHYKTDRILEVTHVDSAIQEDIPGWRIQLDNHVSVFQAANRDTVELLIKKHKREKNWPAFFKAKETFADLRPIFANTVNKAQGSTYDVVLIDVQDIGKNKKNSELARLMYTAITRASTQVYMTGNLPRRVYATVSS